MASKYKPVTCRRAQLEYQTSDSDVWHRLAIPEGMHTSEDSNINFVAFNHGISFQQQDAKCNGICTFVLSRKQYANIRLDKAPPSHYELTFDCLN